MSISRRQFILGTAAGLILPSYYEKIFSYFENTGEAFLEAPRQTEIELFAADGGGDSYELNWGDPWEEPPEMTVREFSRRFYSDEEEFLDAWGEDWVTDWNAPMDWDYILDFWARTDSPRARAYRLLEDFDLGPDLTGAEAVGEIRFIDGPCPGNDYLGVNAPTQLDLSLLQKRLNDLDAGIRIKIV